MHLILRVAPLWINGIELLFTSFFLSFFYLFYFLFFIFGEFGISDFHYIYLCTSHLRVVNAYLHLLLAHCLIIC